MIVIQPVVNMRKAPSETSEVVSQGLFAEKVTRSQEEGKWSLIATPDGYSGWALSEALFPAEYAPSMQVCCLASHLYAGKDISQGPILTLPYGARVKATDVSDPDWICVELPRGETLFARKGTLSPFKTLTKNEMVQLSQKFLGSPYTWGGRSSFGFDCSGFVQMLYGEMGVFLPRDSGMQAEDLRLYEIEEKAMQPGDLIFWGRSSHQIRHVGVFLEGGQFIHATGQDHKPYLRISSLKDPSVYPYRIFKTLY